MKTLADLKCRLEIETRLDGLRPDTARRWGKMSAPQMVCHLADGFRMYMGLRAVADDSTLFMRTAVKWIAIWTPSPGPAVSLLCPNSIKTAPEPRPASSAGTSMKYCAL
jgi:hypothetical protein